MSSAWGQLAGIVVAAVLGGFSSAGVLAQPAVRLTPGMVITRSVRIEPGTYRLAAPPSMDSALIHVRGRGITVELRDVTIIGASEDSPPDAAAGVALRIDGGARVTVRGGTIRGFKVAILARATRDLRLIDADVSHNWKPRMYSLVEHESLVDWLSYHHNEQNEWLRYGAAIYLDGVHGGEVRGVRAEQGMNGLMMARTDSVLVWNRTFSYNSGVGIGLYRASDNRIMHNRVDYNVRGYSHGFYRRGQDSAGILVFEQSCRNVVAYNSVTHGGDGFFLWAGQQTMDSGEGGANDNVLYRNDFSHAPTNGVEVTFSRNVIVGNRIEENDHGIWGGYSHETVMLGNSFADNRIGIAIEHGQDNVIAANQFTRDSTGIRLWWNALEPSDWGYPKHRDTRSRGYLIAGNTARGLRTWLRVNNTQQLEARDTVEADTVAALSGDSSSVWVARVKGASAGAGADAAGDWQRATGLPQFDFTRGDGVHAASRARALAAVRALPTALRGGQLAFLPSTAVRGRATIIVDDWGPYDWRSPKLWPESRSDDRPLALRLLGPPGRWRVVARSGIAALSDTSGRVPGRIVVTPDSTAEFEDWTLELEYVGAATTSPRGVRTPAGAPVRVRYRVTQPRTTWQQRIVSWSDSTVPRRAAHGTDAIFAGAPLLSRATPTLDYQWFRPQVVGIPLDHWALDAHTSLTIPDGAWELFIISDDGVRVWIDDRLVIDAWTAHESRVDRVPIAPGPHRLRVAYYQIDGWTELRLGVEPAATP